MEPDRSEDRCVESDTKRQYATLAEKEMGGWEGKKRII